MGQQSSTLAIRICVLAAGESSRFGANKLLQNFRGRPLLQHALIASLNSRAASTTLVVGKDSDAVVAAANGLADRIVVNTGFANGIGGSIACGVEDCRHDAAAVIVLLADQPLITAQHLDTLCDTWSGAADAAVVTAFDGVDGPPVLFPSDAFPALCRLQGAGGAKRVLQDANYTVCSVPFADAGFDIDTADDLARLRRRYESEK